MPWNCGICGVSDDRLRISMRHIKNIHFDKDKLDVICGIDGCNNRYHLPDSWYRHVKKKHGEHYNERSTKTLITQVIADVVTSEGNLHEIEEEEYEITEHEEIEENLHSDMDDDEKMTLEQDVTNILDLSQEEAAAEMSRQCDDDDIIAELATQAENETDQSTYDGQIELLNKKAAIYILGLKPKHSLTQKALDDIQKGCKEMVASVAAHLHRNINERIALDDSLEGKEAIQYHTDKALKYLHDPFKNIHTGYRQKVFMRKNWSYVDANAMVLGSHLETKLKNNVETYQDVDDVYYHVNIAESIKQFLYNRDVCNMVFSEKEFAPEGYIIDFWDGTVFKENQMLSQFNSTGENEEIVAIQLYYDDVEVCNPLTNNSHNIAMFYYRLANIDPMYRSMLPSMRLIGATETKYLKKYGIDNVLERILEDLKDIHDVGIDVQLHGREINIKGSVHMVLGDTPAAAAVGGFKEGVGLAKYKCRICICPDEKMQKCFREDDFTLLNLNEYKANCLKLNAAKNKSEFTKMSRDFGINRKSSMVFCPDFDLTKHIPMDIMHVLQEGVIEYELKLVLKYFIQEEGVFDLKSFNNGIDAYFAQIKTEQEDHPNTITTGILDSRDNKLKQTATKMKNLIKSMPFVLNELISKDDTTEIIQKHLDLVQELLEITHFAFSPVISQNRLDEMRDHIEKHLVLFKELFEEKRIMPKQHYMLHIPTNIAMFGPAFRYSTSRFESEHRPHKRRIIHQQNYKNVAFSVVESAQMENSVAAESPEGQHPLFQKELVTGKCSKMQEKSETSMKRRLKAAYPQVNLDNIINIQTSKNITVCGEKYYSGYSFVVCDVKSDMFVFGKVAQIYLVQSSERPSFTQLLFDVCIYRSIGMVAKLQAYRIETDPLQISRRMITVEDLPDYTSYHAIKYKRALYIPLSFEPIGLIKLIMDGHVGKHNQLARRGRYAE